MDNPDTTETLGTRHITRKNKTKNTTQKTKTMSNTDFTKINVGKLGNHFHQLR